MKSYKISCAIVIAIFSLGFSATPVFAGNIVKCVDPGTGKITFTDRGCKAKQKTENTRLTKKKVNEKQEARHYTVSEIGGLTTQADKSCTDQYMDKFRSENPKMRIKPNIEFPSILERSINRDAVHIILEGTAKYEQADKMINTDLKCTASRRSEDKDWQIVLKNTGQFATAIEKKKKDKKKSTSEEEQRALGSMWK